MADSARERDIGSFMEAFGPAFSGPEWNGALRARLADSLSFKELEPGRTILREGQSCASVPFVIEGSIRLYRISESGREITLYRLGRGQFCILGLDCGRFLPAFPATTVADARTFAAFIPSEAVRLFLADSPSFRDFALAQFSGRLVEIMELVEEVAFRRVDERLAQFLSQEAARSSGRRVEATHRELADHIGSSREVVSRILKDWELRGALSISRGSIELSPGFEAAVR